MLGLKIKIDNILKSAWNPIGVEFSPANNDEYFSYVDEILICKNEKQIQNLLNDIRTKRMMLEGNIDVDSSVARLIFALPEMKRLMESGRQ